MQVRVTHMPSIIASVYNTLSRLASQLASTRRVMSAQFKREAVVAYNPPYFMT